MSLPIGLANKVTRTHLRLSDAAHYPRAMTTPLFTITASDPALPLGQLPTNVRNVSGVLAALLAVRKMQASGLKGINIVTGGQSVSIRHLEASVEKSVNEFIAKSTDEDLLKEYELTRGAKTDPRTAPLLAELQRRSLVQDAAPE